MNKSIVQSHNSNSVVTTGYFNPEQVRLIKRTIMDETATDDDLLLFGQVCTRLGLDPFAKQINAIKRGWGANEKWSFEPTIDGYRAVADATGQYGGSECYWCDSDGIWVDVWLKESLPAAAKCIVWRKDSDKPFVAVAKFNSYKGTKKDGTLNSIWKKFPDLMIAKCFTPDTEVLTDQGFQRFDSVTGKILQVTSSGLEKTDSIPFVQSYFGDMIGVEGDMLNFCVTPNHDMVTTVGKVEAQVLLKTARNRANWWHIPMTNEVESFFDYPIEDSILLLTGYILADGTFNGYQKGKIEVSRPYKIEALKGLESCYQYIRHCKGNIAEASTRSIVTNFDKNGFTFEYDKISQILDCEKKINMDFLLQLSQRQARLLLDAWQKFDGHTNKKTGVRRIYTNRQDHVSAIELLAVLGGYCISRPKKRSNDISNNINWYLTISELKTSPIVKHHANRQGIKQMSNEFNEVWCATVPSGKIVVRRNGFSMICGNCAESLALRKAFPRQLSGVHTQEEMDQSQSSPQNVNQDVKQHTQPPKSDILGWNVKQIKPLREKLGWDTNTFLDWLKENFGVSHPKELEFFELERLIADLQQLTIEMDKADLTGHEQKNS